MQKEISSSLRNGLNVVLDSKFFSSNSELSSKSFRVIFSLEVLMMYIDELPVKVKGKPTYLSKLRALKELIKSSLDDSDLVDIKIHRNSLAHSADYVIRLFTDPEKEEDILDKVLSHILIMISECIEFTGSELDIIISDKEKQDALEESSIFTKQ